MVSSLMGLLDIRQCTSMAIPPEANMPARGILPVRQVIKLVSLNGFFGLSFVSPDSIMSILVFKISVRSLFHFLLMLLAFQYKIQRD